MKNGFIQLFYAIRDAISYHQRQGEGRCDAREVRLMAICLPRDLRRRERFKQCIERVISLEASPAMVGTMAHKGLEFGSAYARNVSSI